MKFVVPKLFPPKKFGSFKKKQYLCTRFQGKGV